MAATELMEGTVIAEVVATVQAEAVTVGAVLVLPVVEVEAAGAEAAGAVRSSSGCSETFITRFSEHFRRTMT